MKNSNCNYLIKLNSIIRRSKSIISDAELAKKMYENFELDEANKYAMKLEDTAERLVLTARELPVCTWKAGAKEEVENQYSDIIKIKIGFTQTGLLAVILPFLLPKKESGSAEFGWSTKGLHHGSAHLLSYQGRRGKSCRLHKEKSSCPSPPFLAWRRFKQCLRM